MNFFSKLQKSNKDILFCIPQLNQLQEYRIAHNPKNNDSRERIKDLIEIAIPNKKYLSTELRLNHKSYKNITLNSRLARIRLQKKGCSVLFRHNACDFRPNYRYRFCTSYGLGIAKYYDLLQINIPALDYIISNYKGGHVIDLACGLGNLLPYLGEHIDRNKILGVDNFSEITYKEAVEYQKLCHGNYKLSNIIPSNTEIEYLVTSGLSPSKVWDEYISKAKPEKIICDSKHVIELLMKIPNSKIITLDFNSIISVLKIDYF